MSKSEAQLMAPRTAGALITQQVGSNAIHAGLFFSWFPVTSLPYFIAGAAILTIPIAQSSGCLLARFGPVRVVPVLLAFSGARRLFWEGRTPGPFLRPLLCQNRPRQSIEYKLKEVEPPSKETVEHACAQFRTAGLKVY